MVRGNSQGEEHMNVGRYLRGEDRHVGTARTTQFQQPQRKPLTDEEIHSVRDSFGEDPVMLVAFARAIEAAIKDNNT